MPGAVTAVLAVASPLAYGVTAGLGAAVTVGVVLAARRRPGRWTTVVVRVLGTLLLADAVSYVVAVGAGGRFSPATSLPLPLCDMAVLVAAAACWWRVPLLVELTYFWGLAGTLQAIVTPDLGTGFPHLVFFQYLVGHLGIVMAALLLVVGLRTVPRRGAVARVLGISAAYTAVVGTVDAFTGADYMFLRRPPAGWTLLEVLGPWPWYVASAAGVAVVLFLLLDAPFGLSGRAGPRLAAPHRDPRPRPGVRRGGESPWPGGHAAPATPATPRRPGIS